MTRIWAAAFAMAITTARLSGQQTADKQSDKIRIPVLVYNYAGLSMDTVERAETRVNHLFAPAGILFEWPNRALQEDEILTHRAIALKILPQRMYRSLPVHVGALGFTTAGGRESYIFTERVSMVAKYYKAPFSLVFDYAIAHELCHAVRGDTFHAVAGIMQADWDRNAIVAILRERLEFSKHEVEELHAGALRWLEVVTQRSAGVSVSSGAQAEAPQGSLSDDHAQAQTGVEANLGITIRVYNYAQASAGTIAAAQQEATRILKAAGVELLWVGCPTSAQYDANQARAFLKCRELLGSREIVLRILPESTPARASFRDTMFGFADGSVLASIFYGRVERLALRQDAEPSEIPVILGHAIAHEIGHLLLGQASHSPTGIMCAQWDRKYLQRALMGRELFTPEQSRRIQATVLGRMDQQQLPRTSAHGSAN